MTAKNIATETSRKDGIIQIIPMIATETIYKGSTVLVNADWFALTNDWTTNTLIAWMIFSWICVENITSVIEGDTDVRVYRNGSFLLTFADTLTQANVWDKVYINNTTDDSVVTVTKDAWVDVLIWKIIEFVSATTAYVSIIVDVVAWVDWDLIWVNDIADNAISKDKLDYEVVEVNVSWATSGTWVATTWSTIIWFNTTAITWAENVKTVDISWTTVTVTLTWSDTATVNVILIKATV